MHSHQTKNPKRWHKSVTQSDVILNVKDIRKYAKNQGRCDNPEHPKRCA